MPFHVYKWLGSLAEPVNLFAVLLFLALAMALMPWEGTARYGRKLGFFLALVLLLIAVVPVGQWSLLPLENAFAHVPLPEKVDGILMLTGDESPSITQARGVPVGGWATQRHVALARLAKRYPKARLVVVGQTELSANGAMTTKTVVQDNLDAMGVPRERVEYEPQSRTTHENAVMAKNFVKPKEGQVWLVITSAWHLPRSVLCFEKAGWKVVPYATDYFTVPHLDRPHALDAARQLRYLDRAFHEYVGLVTYRLAGWTDALWVSGTDLRK